MKCMVESKIAKNKQPPKKQAIKNLLLHLPLAKIPIPAAPFFTLPCSKTLMQQKAHGRFKEGGQMKERDGEAE